MRSDNPEEAVSSAQPLDIHLAIGPGRKIDKVFKAKMPMLAEAPILQLAEPLHTGGLVAGKEEAVPDTGDSREVLVQRVVHMPERSPVGERQGDLINGFHGISVVH